MNLFRFPSQFTRQLPAQLIHNDANDGNVLVAASAESPFELRVSSIVDFGDMVHAPRICDLAVACTYASLGKPDWLGAAAYVVAGYQAVAPLDERELELLFDLIRARLCLSVCLCAYQVKH